jgi:hypothetical protein
MEPGLFSLRGVKPFQFCILLLAFFPAARAYGQETVFDVPSPDVLDKGMVYGELDGTIRPNDSMYTFTPRVVIGIGHQIEAGLNFNGLNAVKSNYLTLSPTIKWRIWRKEESGWSIYIGDDLFFPIHRRTYNAGNYSYAVLVKEWKSGTRIGMGGYDFTKNVVAAANRAGGQFTFEQRVTNRLTLAAEWYTGNHASGYFNPGGIFKLTSKLTVYAAYQIGNAGVTAGNHMFLWELGYNFN